MKRVTLYTDGACSGNPGPGGWGFLLKFGEFKKESSGYEPATTNNRMELLAAIMGLRALKEPCEVDLFSDSAYLINAFEKGWIRNWKRNGWHTADGGDVLNQDLWRELHASSLVHKINWIKVKGHSDNESNNRCDELAREAIKSNR